MDLGEGVGPKRGAGSRELGGKVQAERGFGVKPGVPLSQPHTGPASWALVRGCLTEVVRSLGHLGRRWRGLSLGGHAPPSLGQGDDSGSCLGEGSPTTFHWQLAPLLPNSPATLQWSV